MNKDDFSYQNNAVVNKSQALLFREHTCMVMQSSHLIKSLPEVDPEQLESKKVFLEQKFSSLYNGVNQESKHLSSTFAKSSFTGKRKTIIFDMDETLIHRLDSSDNSEIADIYLEVPTENNSQIVKVGFYRW